MVNLISAQHRDGLILRYRMRLVTSALYCIATVIIIAAVLLIPSYAYLMADVSESERALDAIQKTVALQQASKAQEYLVSVKRRVDVLAAAHRDPSFNRIVESIATGRPASVSIEQFDVTFGEAPSVVVSGFAKSREQLIRYAEEIRARPDVTRVDLPINQLVDAENIEFRFEVTLTTP
ncbi:MAG: hypothetical protein AAB573_05115 [Patescibacteria group bacterium]